MSGRQVNRSNTYSRVNHPNNASFLPRNPGWTQCPGLNYLKGSEFSTCSNHSEQSSHPTSPRLPRGRVCMGQPYSSKCVETSHLAKGPKVARKSVYHRTSPHCLLCTDRPTVPSSPTFLDQLVRGINYLDRSTSFYNCPKTLSLPRLAANYLERAANSLYLDHMEHSQPRSYSSPSASMAAPDHTLPGTCMVPSTGDASALQCLAGSTSMSCQHRPHSQSLPPTLRPMGSGVKLPEIPLFANGLFSLDRLPKFWEAIRAGWSTPEPTSKPWW